jgi:hypothetical protein
LALASRCRPGRRLAGLVAVEASDDEAGVLIPANAETLCSYVGDVAFTQ